MKKTIRDFKLDGKKVLMRVDFNVPLDGKVITDDSRIKAALESINYAIENNAKLILFSHLARVENIEDMKKYSLDIVAKHLSELLNKKITFINKTRGKELEEAINNMKEKDIILVENTRFEDIDGKKESNCDRKLSKYWSSLGDIFINDAFGTAHRKHSSNVGIAKRLPSGIGFLVEKELNSMDFDNMDKPVAVILGGSKVNDKINIIRRLSEKVDYVLIGGGMAFTFLKALNINIGDSLVDNDSIDFCKEMLSKYKDKIILPIDAIVSSDMKTSKSCFINDIEASEKGLDIGYNTVKLFRSYLSGCKTVVWNGPLGMFENPLFAKGTDMIASYLSELDNKVIIGGGDTALAIKDYKDKFYHVSTGGGASLKLLEGSILPGIDCIDDLPKKHKKTTV